MKTDPFFPNPDRLDPGIRDLVLHLRSLGYVTTDSGDGVSKPPEGRVLDIPHVFIRVDGPGDLREEANRLARHLGDFGCTVEEGWWVEATYNTQDDLAILAALGPAA